MKHVRFAILALVACTAFVLSNPNCPTGKTGAPSASTGSSSNCSSCHGDYSVNSGGGSITLTGLPSTYVPGSSYSFSIKINHPTTDRKVWGYAIKAIDTVTRNVVGMWSTTNANSSVKGTAGSTSYELSHANAATTTAGANTYTYTNLTWTAPALPTINQARVKFYVAVIAGNNNGNEAGDYVYTTTFTSNQYVAPPACTFTYGPWTSCSNGTQIRTYTTSPAGCTGTPPADSIQRICTVPVNTLPTSVTITPVSVTGACDTLKTFTVPYEANVHYAWSISGVGNSIILGQGTNSITAITKVAGSAYVTLSNAAGSIPTVSSAFTRALPPTPSAINGSLTPCPNSSIAYTLTVPTPSASQVAAVVYRWTIPANSSITSASADSSSVTIAYGANFNGGSITAKGQSACNIFGAAKSITVAPAKPLDVVSSTGFWNACIGDQVVYSVVAPTTTTQSMFRWTKPLSTSIVSANADSSMITLSFNTGYRGGALAVKSSTSCNVLGTAASKTLTHLNCAPGLRGTEVLAEDQSIVYPNPSTGTFTLNVQSKEKWTGVSMVRLIDQTGKTVLTYNVPVNNGIFSKTITANVSRGIYVVTYNIGNNINSLKLQIK
jgi:hypothetical protein